MLPDRVSNPGPLTYESGALPIALRGPASYPGSQGERKRIQRQRVVLGKCTCIGAAKECFYIQYKSKVSTP